MKITIAYKWCEKKSVDPTKKVDGQWILSHIKFLRAGDVFKIPDAGEFMAVSSPYWNPALKEMDIKMVRRQ